MNELQIIRLHKDAKLPVRKTKYSAGYDLYSLYSGTIKPKDKSIIKTGIAIRIPKNDKFKIYGRIASRSGLSVKYSIEVGAGVIDYDYTDEINVILYNHSNVEFFYEKNDRIAQLILEYYITPDIIECTKFDNIDSDRIGGLGSTGR